MISITEFPRNKSLIAWAVGKEYYIGRYRGQNIRIGYRELLSAMHSTGIRTQDFSDEDLFSCFSRLIIRKFVRCVDYLN